MLPDNWKKKKTLGNIENRKKSKVGDLSQGWTEGSLYNSYYTTV